jgi:hypothetical protein
MATAQDRLKILQNIVAKVGLDGDLVGEYSRAMSMLNGFNSYQAMQPPPMPPMTPQDNAGGTMPPDPTQVPPTDQSGLNQPPMM